MQSVLCERFASEAGLYVCLPPGDPSVLMSALVRRPRVTELCIVKTQCHPERLACAKRVSSDW